MYAFRTMLILDEFFTGRKFTSMSNILVRLNFQLANAINVIILTDNLAIARQTNGISFDVYEMNRMFVEFVYEGISCLTVDD